jgi:hypothetical protein
MTTAHEALARLIFDAPARVVWEGQQRVIATTLLDAGYRKTRTITTDEGLFNLPDGSVVIDREGDVSQKRDSLWCGYEMAPISSQKFAKVTAPFTVLHEGSEATR